MKFFMSLAILSFSVLVCGQITTTVTPLAQTLSETSGLIFLNNHLITHNDMDGEAALYEIDSMTGNYSRKVIIENATNHDWEDIANDENYIYIGDFGNNDGIRTDLKIYKVLITDYENSLNDTVQAQIISFNYANQISFTPSPFTTNFDAEAMVVFNDSIYVFTKNWGNQKSDIYAIPNSIGNYTVSKIDSINPQGLISGATYNSISHTLVLCGYQTLPFIYSASELTPPNFSSSAFMKTNLNVQNSIQIEGVTSIGQTYYFGAEQNILGSAALYRLNLENGLNLHEEKQPSFHIFPNPSAGILNIETDQENFQISIYDSRGLLVLESSSIYINCSNLRNGIYLVQCTENDHRNVMTKKIVIY